METLGKIPVASLVFLVASLDYLEVPSSQPPATRTTYQLTMKTKIAFVSFCVLIQAVVCSAEDRRGPFTHARRSVRTRFVDQQHISLQLTLDFEQQAFAGRVIHHLIPFQALRELTLDAADMQVRAVQLLGARGQKTDLKFTHQSPALKIILPAEQPIGQEFHVAIDYRVSKPKHGLHFVSPDKEEPGQQVMSWTQSEPEYARYWFPCIDSPADRVTSETMVTVPASFMVLSNGTRVATRTNANGTKTWHWKQVQSHVPYLISVVAGDFEAFEQEWNGIPITSYVPRGRLADAERSFVKTKAMMDFYSKKIGLKYPWPKYAQICVDEYSWGGMEHTSATTLNLGTLHDARAHLDVSSDGLVAHELVHQWFGDLMTCKDWGELWLNESFATYFQTLWTEHDLGLDEVTWERYQDGESYKSEDKRYRRSLVNYHYNGPNNMFDRHSYPKGGRVLHMLRYVLGDELFWRAVNRYVMVNKFRSVETADFRIAIEDATGQGLNWFFDQWVHQGGHPDFDVAWTWNPETKTVRVTVKQTQTVDDVTPLFRMPVDLEIANSNASRLHRVEVSKAEETFHFQVATKPTRVCFDPAEWILKNLKTEKGKDELLDQLAYSPYVISRLRAIQQLQEMTKDKDVAAALERALGTDRFWGVREEAAKALAKFNGTQTRVSLMQAAQGDEKSLVRRAAVTALGNFKHAETNAVLRQVIQQDRSYYAVAEALRSLVKVDRKNCERDLLNALAMDSHREVVLRAAGDGLVQVKSTEAEKRLRTMLASAEQLQKRAAIISSLARIKPDDEAVMGLLAEQLKSNRRAIRSAAISAIAQIGKADHVDLLLAQRAGEESQSILREIDTAVTKLREKARDVEKMQSELDRLRKQNQALEKRLEKLERNAPGQ